MSLITEEYLEYEKKGFPDRPRCCVHSKYAKGGKQNYCQFGPKQKTVFHNNKHYCHYHLPADPKRKWTEDQNLQFKKALIDIIQNGHQTSLGLEKSICDFSAVVFPENTDLSGLEFNSEKVCFEKAIFMGSVNFQKTSFLGIYLSFMEARLGQERKKNVEINFSHVNFSKDTLFDNAYFRADIVNFKKAYLSNHHTSFLRCQFESNLTIFDEAYTKKGVELCFEYSRFEQNQKLSFANAKLVGTVNFKNSYFFIRYGDFQAKSLGTISLDFTDSEFTQNCALSFQNLVFPKKLASFDKVKFPNGNKDFSNTKFDKCGISFKKTNFGNGDCTFRNSECHGNANFEKASFGEGHINFENFKIAIPTKFCSENTDTVLSLNFTTNSNSVSQSWEIITFKDAQINAEISFENRKFLNCPDFENCEFYYAPDFAGAEMHPSTSFQTAIFHDERYEISERYDLLKTLMKQQSNKATKKNTINFM